MGEARLLGKDIERRSFLKFLGGASAAAVLARVLESPFARADLPPDHVTETIKALVDTIAPSTPNLPFAVGGVEVNAHEFTMDAFDTYLPLVPTQQNSARLRDAVAGALDGHAQQVTPGKTFIEQAWLDRVRTIEAMDNSSSGDVRFIAFAMCIMAALGIFSEWPVLGRKYEGDHDYFETHPLPVVWTQIGFPGPVDGFPKLLYPYNPGDPIDPTTP